MTAPVPGPLLDAVVLLVIVALQTLPGHTRFRVDHSPARRQATIALWATLKLVGYGAAAALALLIAGDRMPQIMAWSTDTPGLGTLRSVYLEGGWDAAALLGVPAVLWCGWLAYLCVRVIRRTRAATAAIVSRQQFGLRPLTVTWLSTRPLSADPISADARKAFFAARIPRNAAEAWSRGVGGSLVDGLTEEVLYRVGIPVLFLAMTGNVALSLVLSVLMFGAGHTYQGLRGVVVTTLFGTALMLTFLVTHSILLCVAVHALNNMIAFAVQPSLLRSTVRRELRKLQERAPLAG